MKWCSISGLRFWVSKGSHVGNMKNQHPRRKMAIKPFRVHERGVSPLFILAIVAVIAVLGIAIYKYFPRPVPKSSGSNLVRGYLAAAVGRSGKAESGGLY